MLLCFASGHFHSQNDYVCNTRSKQTTHEKLHPPFNKEKADTTKFNELSVRDFNPNGDKLEPSRVCREVDINYNCRRRETSRANTK